MSLRWLGVSRPGALGAGGGGASTAAAGRGYEEIFFSSLGNLLIRYFARIFRLIFLVVLRLALDHEICEYERQIAGVRGEKAAEGRRG